MYAVEVEGHRRSEAEVGCERDIAVIGLSCRCPGARDAAELWRNLCAGVESITFFSEDELRSAGIGPELLANRRYVRAKGVVEDADLFAAAAFGFTPREAEILDPQHRLFLECASEALEDAGWDPRLYEGLIAVYAGAGASTYLMTVLGRDEALLSSVGLYQVMLGNDKDYLPTMVSYKLDLTGPSFGVQSACSTSLVAIHQACQSLLAYECDMALAGGSTIVFPQKSGYLHRTGGVLSPDGHCRTFDATARGTAPGSGVGVVVLKRLADALRDRDAVYAVVKGSAVNNDGAQKVGFTAPSVAGQADVIAAAQAMAGVEAESITYVETHGTGTALGDPIEIEALTQSFRDHTDAQGFCAVGSIKTNVGHLDTAAGVAGFIKTVLALHHRRLPPSLHFEKANPAIDFEASPFFVNSELRDWEPGPSGVRRAGVSSFGIGGTNAHVVLEEWTGDAENAGEVTDPRDAELLVLSARSATTLDQLSSRLAEHLDGADAPELADTAYTLQVGRRAFAHRRAVVARDRAGAVAALAAGDPRRVFDGVHERGRRGVAFLFPGQGAQHVDMALELYRGESTFRRELDHCAEALGPHLGADFRRTLYPEASRRDEAAAALTRTELAQPVLFAVSYALAELWAQWGVEPRAMIGHSIGELVAACRAGVMSRDDALVLVAARGRLMQSLPTGSMLAVPLPEAELQPLLDPTVALAAVNGPTACTVSGPTPAIDAWARRLRERGAPSRRLHTSHAFHSAMTEPILDAWAEALGQIELRAPEVPVISNLTGGWMKAEEATDPNYWVRHLRHTVRFADGCRTLLEEPGPVLVEVGPGRTLSTLARQQEAAAERLILTSLRHPRESHSDTEHLLTALGRLWLSGVEVSWQDFQTGRGARRAHLPAGPLERQSYWPDGGDGKPGERPAPAGRQAAAVARPSARHARPALQVAYAPPRTAAEEAVCEIFQDLLGIGEVGVHDDFFELGGSSLLAVSLMARIEERLGAALPVSALSDAASVEELARLSALSYSSSPIVELEAGGDEPGFFWVHPIGGDVLCYLDLTRRLGGERPVYAFRALPPAGAEEPAARIEDLAERYLDELRAKQATGPYLLGGWSFGGLVAYEMARLVAAAGETVELLALIDSWPPAAGALPPAGEEGQVARLAWFFRDLVGGRSLELGLTAEELAALPAEKRFDLVLERATAAELLPGAGEAERLKELHRLFEAHTRALADFRPQPSAVRMVLFEAGERGAGPGGEARWRELGAAPAAVHQVEGHHYSIMKEPRVGIVAEHLRAHLESSGPDKARKT